jgi:hypothetical protein
MNEFPAIRQRVGKRSDSIAVNNHRQALLCFDVELDIEDDLIISIALRSENAIGILGQVGAEVFAETGVAGS